MSKLLQFPVPLPDVHPQDRQILGRQQAAQWPPAWGSCWCLVFYTPSLPPRVPWLVLATLSYTSQHRLQVFSVLNNRHLTQPPSLPCGSI